MPKRRIFYRHELGIGYDREINYDVSDGYSGGEIPDDPAPIDVVETSEDIEVGKEPLGAIISGLRAALEAIPEPLRASATINFRASGGYDGESYEVSYNIKYRRSETEKEYSWRQGVIKRYWDMKNSDAERKKVQKEISDREEYARLKAKFGDP